MIQENFKILNLTGNRLKKGVPNQSGFIVKSEDKISVVKFIKQ